MDTYGEIHSGYSLEKYLQYSVVCAGLGRLKATYIRHIINAVNPKETI